MMAEMLTIWLIGAVIVAIAARQKGHPTGAWFAYGLLLWPVALVHVLLKPPSAEGLARAARSGGRRPCPSCAEAILPAASLCPHCRTALPAGWAAAGQAPGTIPDDAPPRRFGETEAAWRARLQAGGYLR